MDICLEVCGQQQGPVTPKSIMAASTSSPINTGTTRKRKLASRRSPRPIETGADSGTVGRVAHAHAYTSDYEGRDDEPFNQGCMKRVRPASDSEKCESEDEDLPLSAVVKPKRTSAESESDDDRPLKDSLKANHYPTRSDSDSDDQPLKKYATKKHLELAHRRSMPLPSSIHQPLLPRHLLQGRFSSRIS